MFEAFFRNIMYGERSIVPTDRQEKEEKSEVVVPGVSKESTTIISDEPFYPSIEEPIPEMKNDVDPEILLLAQKYGLLGNGVKIELTLKEALELFPRQRKKSDAYKGLIRKVKEQFNTELTIGTKRKKGELR